MVEFEKKDRYGIEDLRRILVALRSDNGCPWDKAQTHESIRKNLIEETYEVVEAIDNSDSSLMREELGDLLLQVVFHARIEEEEGRFNFDDVTHDVCEKLYRRHPHVFGTVSASDGESALGVWESVKTEEKNRKTVEDQLKAVPPCLPALMRASKVIGKAVKNGYEADSESILSGIKKIIMSADSISDLCSEDAIGEILFGITAISALKGIDLEEILNKKTSQFVENYPKMRI